MRRKRLLLIASAGGHWVQLLRLSPAFEGHDCCFVTTMKGASGPTGETTKYIRDASRSRPVGLALMYVQILWLMLWEAPDIVITTGAAPGLAAVQIGKIIGARTVWIDSLANSDHLSLSGRFARRFSDLWLTQWPHLVDGHPKMKTFGSVL